MAVLKVAPRLAAALCAAFIALAAPAAHAHQPDPVAIELQVKAAYLYKFASYVEWPARSFSHPASPLVIGVAGDEELAAQLEAITRTRQVGGHPVSVRRIYRGDPLDGLHILFVGGGRPFVARMLDEARGQAVLTVTDSLGAHAQGSMINFVVADGRLRFEVALPQVHQAQLRISARMLSAARRVQRGTS